MSLSRGQRASVTFKEEIDKFDCGAWNGEISGTLTNVDRLQIRVANRLTTYRQTDTQLIIHLLPLL